MANYRHYSIDFKRRLVEDYLSGVSAHELSRRYDVGRALIRLWAQKAEAGAFSDEAVSARMVKHYERRIEALERLAGRQALDLEFREFRERQTVGIDPFLTEKGDVPGRGVSG